MRYLIVLLLMCSAASAQTISGVTGSVTLDSTITVAGSSFGSAGPTVVLFDDFEHIHKQVGSRFRIKSAIVHVPRQS